jgi:meiotic recombination protein REC8
VAIRLYAQIRWSLLADLVCRPEQLVLQDDPSFLPDFALPPPELLADLDLAIPLVTPQSGESQSLTPFGSQVVPGTPRGLIAGLVLPSSSSRDLGDFGLAGDNEPSSVRGSGLFVGEDLLAPLADPDFAFDDDGNILVNGANPITPKVSGRAAVQSDAETSVSVRQRREEQQTGDVEVSMPANSCW